MSGALSDSGRPVGRPADAGAPVVAFEGRLFDADLPRAVDRATAPDLRSFPADFIAAHWPLSGAALVDRLVGDYALAVFDPRNRELTLATDAVGQAPLYYATSPDGTMLAFASRTQPLRALDWVASVPDDDFVVAVLAVMSPQSGRSFFRDIRQLPCGHRLRWRDGHLDVARYWDPRRGGPDIRSVEEMLEAFEQAVRTAVAARLDPVGPTAILMSGGYDSTSVAGAAATLRRESPGATRPVFAVSATFGDLACDESARIDLALADNGLPGRRVQPTGSGITADAMRRDVARHDGPFVDFQAPFMDASFAAARELGCRTIMTGMGGDELTTDYDYHFDLARTLGPWRFPATVRKVAAAERMSSSKAALWLARQFCPEAVKEPYRRLRRAIRPASESPNDPEWLAPEARRTAARLRTDAPPYPAGPGSVTAALRWQTFTHPIAEWTRRWFFVETAAREVAFVHPLHDRRLFELVLGTDIRFHPRTFDRGEYKPLIARGLPFAPRRLVGAYWKVVYGSYNAHVLTRSLPAVEDWLFGAGEWRAERYVARDSAMQLLSRCRDDPMRLHYRVEAIVGLETWLRGLGESAVTRENAE